MMAFARSPKWMADTDRIKVFLKYLFCGSCAIKISIHKKSALQFHNDDFFLESYSILPRKKYAIEQVRNTSPHKKLCFRRVSK